MNINIHEIHQQAMFFYDQAIFDQRKGITQNVDSLYKQAFDLEQQAAMMSLKTPTATLDQALLFRGAITLAIQIQEYRQAECLICQVLLLDLNLGFQKEFRQIWLKIMDKL
ncbi:MAG: hypothetical protein EAZ97_06705 [Bacteroidetes bacterium]|nr:MAG: hypothetical protein EAZ97_06705 [Bacteroidota bacterium]